MAERHTNAHRRRPRGRSATTGGPRHLVAAVVAAAVIAGSQALIPVPVQAQTEADAVKELPALASEPVPEVPAVIATGDFTNPPVVGQQGPAPKPVDKDHLAPTDATLVESETTPTQQVFKEKDGSHTAVVSLAPTRFQDPAGAWRDFDNTLVAAGDGSLTAKAGFPTRLAGQAQGAVVTFDTPLGPIVVRHPDAAPAKAVADGNTATYPGALSGGRDLTVTLSTEGFEQSVVLPDAASEASYVEEFLVPAGVTARNAEDGVEFLDPDGKVLVTYGRGLAHDATWPAAGPDASSPVSVRLAEAGAAAPPKVEDPAGAESTTPAPTTTSAAADATPDAATPDAEAAAPAPEAEPEAAAEVLDTDTDPPATDPSVLRVEVRLGDPSWLADPARKFPVTLDPTAAYRFAYAASANIDMLTFDAAPTANYNTYPYLSVGSAADHRNPALSITETPQVSRGVVGLM